MMVRDVPPDVSVIIAAYNVGSYIERAIHSALDQYDVTVEAVLVDDNSTDNTWEIVCSINDSRLRCIKLPQNGGPSVARNTGIAAAASPWIAILDGDDIFLPGRLARILQRARTTKADIVVDNIRVSRESDAAIFPMFEPKKFGQHTTLGLAQFIAGNQSFLGGEALGYLKPVFSSEFLRQHKLAYDPALRIGEDYMLLAEALANDAACAVEPTEGYSYTIRAGSISHRLSLADVMRISEGDKKFLARYTLDPMSAKAQWKRESRLKEAYAFTLCVDALKRRDASAVWQLWRPAWARINRAIN
jgi:succinoglycan biosynthesis protein ExoO